MSPTLNLLLTHQRPEAVEAMLRHWEKSVPLSNILVAHGGSPADFHALNFAQKIFIDDPRLRTRDHQRECQSYAGVFRSATTWLQDRDFDYIHFAEYDHLPLIPDLNQRQLALLHAETADVLGLHLRRVDQTNCPHLLAQSANPDFLKFWKKITRRADPTVVLSMIATGSFWTRESFTSVASIPEPHPIYVEIFPPTLAHHLGFRLRNFSGQNPFVRHVGDRFPEIAAARQAGAWTLHPVKTAWDQPNLPAT